VNACYQNGWQICHILPPSASDPGKNAGAIEAAACCNLPVTLLNVNEAEKKPARTRVLNMNDPT
jgi:hypothetical protein